MGKSCHRVATTMHTRSTKRSGNRGRNRGFNNSRKVGRRGFFEALESRQLLSITLPTISNVTLPAGTTMYIPLERHRFRPDGELRRDGLGLFQAHAGHDAGEQQDPATEPQHQRHDGDDGFQLFDNLSPATTAAIESLVQSGFYNGLQIYRNGTDGTAIPSSSKAETIRRPATSRPTQSTMAEEFNPNLQYTIGRPSGHGATSTPGSSSTEFFITGEATRSPRFQLHDLRRSNQRVRRDSTRSRPCRTRIIETEGISKRP